MLFTKRPGAMNLLTIDNISKQFSERLLFDRASLHINEGDRIGLIGVNGSGKSTLLRDRRRPRSARRGQRSPRPAACAPSILPQEPPLDDALTVLQTIFRSDSPQMRLLRRVRGDDGSRLAARSRATPPCNRPSCWTLGAEAGSQRAAGRRRPTPRRSSPSLGVTDFDRPHVGSLSGGQRKRVAHWRAP
jgi:ATP-binding cassette subfamily F protein uup